MKNRGDLTLQLNGGGSIRLLVAKCDATLNVRGVAQYDLAVEQEILSADFAAGNLVITYQSAVQAESRQSIVNLQGGSVAESLEHYFLQSEQIPTILTIDHTSSMGLMLQRMPGEKTVDNVAWNKLRDSVVSFPQLRANRSVEEALQFAFPHELIRLFPAEPVSFACPCSKGSMRNALRSLPDGELLDIFSEQDSIGMECEYCLEKYTFSAADLESSD